MLNPPNPEDGLALLIGRVTLTWGAAMEEAYHIFVSVSGMSKEVADRAFFSPRSDTAQRELLRAVASERLRGLPEHLARLDKLLRRLDQLAGERNAAIHTMWKLSDDRTTMRPSSGVLFRYPKLRDDHIRQFEELIAQLEETRASLERVWFDIAIDL